MTSLNTSKLDIISKWHQCGKNIFDEEFVAVFCAGVCYLNNWDGCDYILLSFLSEPNIKTVCFNILNM